MTLEGVDSEVFPEKEEPLGIRSRLGARTLPADTEDQVEVRMIDATVASAPISRLEGFQYKQ